MGIHFVFNTVFGFLTLLRFNGGQGLGTSVEVCWRSLQTHHQDVHCCSDRVPFTADNSSKQCYVIVFTKYTHTKKKNPDLFLLFVSLAKLSPDDFRKTSRRLD